MFDVRASIKVVILAFAVLLMTSATASAQYAWDVTKPTAGGTYSVSSIPVEVNVSWITMMSTAVSVVDAQVFVNGVDRLSGSALSSSTTSNDGETTYTLSGNVEVRTQFPNSPATVKFTAKDTLGNVLSSTSVNIQLEP